jgi:hypothetical protein
MQIGLFEPKFSLRWNEFTKSSSFHTRSQGWVQRSGNRRNTVAPGRASRCDDRSAQRSDPALGWSLGWWIAAPRPDLQRLHSRGKTRSAALISQK